MKKYLGLFVVLLVMLTVNATVSRAEDNASSTDGRKICTMDAKLCPDGSFVSRTGPDCEFARCPGSSGSLPLPRLRDDNTGARADIMRQREAIRAELEQKITVLREEAKIKLDALKTDIKNEKDETKAKIKELRITGRENALKRFDQVVIRIRALEDKVNAFIIKMEAKGLDVTAAKASVAIADTKLTDAKDKIAQINALLVKSITELTAEDKATLKTLAKDTQTLLKDAHSALKTATQSLKDQVKTKMEEEKNTAKTDNNAGNSTTNTNQ